MGCPEAVEAAGLGKETLGRVNGGRTDSFGPRAVGGSIWTSRKKSNVLHTCTLSFHRSV